MKNKPKSEDIEYTVKEKQIPCCPHNSTPKIKHKGNKFHLMCGTPNMKFVYPKMEWEYNKTGKSKRYICH